MSATSISPAAQGALISDLGFSRSRARKHARQDPSEIRAWGVSDFGGSSSLDNTVENR